LVPFQGEKPVETFYFQISTGKFPVYSFSALSFSYVYVDPTHEILKFSAFFMVRFIQKKLMSKETKDNIDNGDNIDSGDNIDTNGK
jgi:hypothetical protein